MASCPTSPPVCAAVDAQCCAAYLFCGCRLSVPASSRLQALSPGWFVLDANAASWSSRGRYCCMASCPTSPPVCVVVARGAVLPASPAAVDCPWPLRPQALLLGWFVPVAFAATLGYPRVTAAQPAALCCWSSLLLQVSGRTAGLLL